MQTFKGTVLEAKGRKDLKKLEYVISGFLGSLAIYYAILSIFYSFEISKGGIDFAFLYARNQLPLSELYSILSALLILPVFPFKGKSVFRRWSYSLIIFSGSILLAWIFYIEHTTLPLMNNLWLTTPGLTPAEFGGDGFFIAAMLWFGIFLSTVFLTRFFKNGLKSATKDTFLVIASGIFIFEIGIILFLPNYLPIHVTSFDVTLLGWFTNWDLLGVSLCLLPIALFSKFKLRK